MSLQSYVDSFTIAGPAGNIIAGMPINLVGKAAEILDIDTTEVVSGPVDLQLVFKHLQLPLAAGDTPWPHDAAVTGGLANIVSGLSSNPAANQVEAWVGSVKGTMPVGLRDIAHTISVEYQWLFFDERGMPIGDISVIGGSLTDLNVSVTVPPVVTDMTTGDLMQEIMAAMPIRTIHVALKVKARLGNTPPVEFTTPKLPIPIIALPLPTVAALFRDQELQGDAVLIMVPAGSPLKTLTNLNDVLSPLQVLLSEVNTAAAVTSWAVGIGGLFSAVTSLASRIPLTLHIAFRERDNHKDLGKDNFIVVDNWFDTDIEDRGSSALIISVSRTITFFQHDDFKGKKLTLNAVPDGANLRIGGAVLRRLHVSNPATDPPGCVSHTGAPDGNWGDKISSFKWA